MALSVETHIYNTSQEPFAEWLYAHRDCQHLILKGTVTDGDNTLTVMNDAIMSSDIRTIDIAEFHILKATEPHEDYWELEQKDAGCWTESVWEDIPFGLLQHAVVNRDYSTRFVLIDDMLLTEDLRTLVFVKKIEEDEEATEHKVTIPASVNCIARYAFMDQEFLDAINIKGPLTSIDTGAFYYCWSLAFQLPATLEKIGPWAFSHCTYISGIKVPPKIDTIPIGCFEYCFSINVDSLAHVKRIESSALEGCTPYDIYLPEGIQHIGPYNFSEAKFVHLPASLTELDPKFYQDAEWEEQSIPYIDVAIGNPVFFDNKGTLYHVGNSEPFLGYEFLPKQEETLLLSTSQFEYRHECSPDELTEHYSNVSPVDANQTMFLVWNGKERYYNIIDRYGNEYLNRSKVEDVQFCFNRFVLVNHAYVYSTDMKDLLLSSDFEEYTFTGCDNEGRLYVMKGEPVDEEYRDLFPDQPLPEFWCIDVQGYPLLKNRYNGLGQFDSYGLAPACIGEKWGMIDADENIVIPFDYKSIGHFDRYGMALVEKGNRKGYVNRCGELVIPLHYNFFYKEFGNDDYAYAMIHSGRDKGGYFVGRNGQVLGKLQPRSKSEDIYTEGFHIFHHNGLFGYCKQFAHDFSLCIYKDIRVVNDTCIEVSADGLKYQQITF